MKLVPKLTLALVTAMCGVLAINAFFRVRREIAYNEADRVRDHEMVARALGAAVSAVWHSEGRAAALRVIDAGDTHFSRMAIRWVEVPEVQKACGDIWPDATAFATAPAGRATTQKAHRAEGMRVHTCLAVDASGSRQGAIELTEKVAKDRQPVWIAVRDASITAIAIASVSALLSLLFGVWLVGRPVTALVDKARRIGHGDFSGPLRLPQSDEFAVLAKEMNAMCNRLSSTVDQLRHADRLTTVGKLASGVAHELGTPLNVISARAAMIAKGETTNGEAVECARIIGNSAKRMTNIIRQLLEFARKKGAQKAPRDVHSLVTEAVELLRPLSEKHAVSLVVDPIPEDLDMAAAVDSAQLEQVVTNLVMNAIQAMPDGGTVRVGVSRESAAPPGRPDDGRSSFLCIRVSDQGKGIEPEHLPHIFEPFYTTKEIGEGTGLGLSVSYGIIQEHGGWIAVDSQAQRGSTFAVFVPPGDAR